MRSQTMFNNHVSKQLSAYCHNELPAEEAARVAAHLRDCARCREEHELIQRGVQLAQQLSHAQAPASLWSEIASALDEPRPRSWFSLPAFNYAAIGAVAVLLVCVGLFWIYSRRVQPDPPIARMEQPAWDVSRIEGQPQVGERRIAESDRMAIGEWLVTDDASRAEIRVGEIGQVQIEPGSRVRLVEAKADNHRLALARGKMQALIWAPPRQFFVDTPSAVAVDLGCAYTLEVNEEGQGLLHVIAGWVAFEWQGRESFVPAGAECITRLGHGPGTPFFSDAGQKFQNALAVFDVAERSSDASSVALRSVLARARRRDALTLWHLLARTEGDDRSRAYDRLAQLVPPPPQVTKENVLGGNRESLDLWWEKLELGSAEWWRMWKGPIPSPTN